MSDVKIGMRVEFTMSRETGGKCKRWLPAWNAGLYRFARPLRQEQACVQSDLLREVKDADTATRFALACDSLRTWLRKTEPDAGTTLNLLVRTEVHPYTDVCAVEGGVVIFPTTPLTFLRAVVLAADKHGLAPLNTEARDRIALWDEGGTLADLQEYLLTRFAFAGGCAVFLDRVQKEDTWFVPEYLSDEIRGEECHSGRQFAQSVRFCAPITFRIPADSEESVAKHAELVRLCVEDARRQYLRDVQRNLTAIP